MAQFCALCIWYYQSEEAALARERRRLAAIVAADVVGYSRLMGRDETGTLARLLLALALTRTSDPAEIARIFATY